ncbi:hypothetical protein G5714_004053 [Onychostoma macrolepis]|uniref:Uncharacterized protein n=1 Tax=Onychostoma macrolepis TaxID=369639 RepID=A0A7J6DCG5_9TELE|nr:hypothetical protein G5714_004053 [Onychostoma macrolepis]
MLLRVQFGEEQKYIKLSELTFDAFLKEVCLKFNIPESRQPDIKVYDQSDTEVDTEVFEEIVKESPGTFRIMLGNGGLGASQSSSCSGTSDDTVILNFMMCDPVEEVAAAEGSQPKRPCHINYEAKVELIAPVISVSSDRLVTSHCVNLSHEIICDSADGSNFSRETIFRARNQTAVTPNPDVLNEVTPDLQLSDQWWWISALIVIVLLVLICFLLRKRIFRYFQKVEWFICWREAPDNMDLVTVGSNHPNTLQELVQ